MEEVWQRMKLLEKKAMELQADQLAITRAIATHKTHISWLKGGLALTIFAAASTVAVLWKSTPGRFNVMDPKVLEELLLKTRQQEEEADIKLTP